MSDFKEEELQKLRAQLATQQAQINSQKESIAKLAAGEQQKLSFSLILKTVMVPILNTTTLVTLYFPLIAIQLRLRLKQRQQQPMTTATMTHLA